MANKIDNEHLFNIFDGDALLFVGAGFSRNTTNSAGEELPLTNELNIELQKMSGISPEEINENLNIQQTSEYFIDVKGEQMLVDYLKEKFTVTEVQEWQKRISSHNWRRIYTTNYDNIIEVSSNRVGIHRYAVAVSKNAESSTGDKDKQIVHLNGYVDYIDKKNLMSSTKLTSQSYIDTHFLDSSWRSEFEIDLDHAKSIFFIGFSLDYDLDLKRIISSNKNTKEKTYFVNGKSRSPITRKSLEKYGTVLDLTGEEFSNLLEEEKLNYRPKTDNKIRTYSFTKKNFEVVKEEIRNQDVADMFFNGEIDMNKLYTYRDRKPYLVNRENRDKVIENLSKYSLFVVHSKLGNGKTFFLTDLEIELNKRGYEVYSYNGDPNNIVDDVRNLLKLKNDKVIIIIDDYYSIKSEFKYFSTLDKSKFKFIVAGRSAVNNNIISEFISKSTFKNEETIVINLDKVEKKEQTQLYKLIENHNLWGTRAAKASSNQKDYIRQISKGGFKKIAIELFKSNSVMENWFSLYKGLNGTLYDIVTAVFINSALRTNLNIQQLQTLLDSTDLSKKEIEDVSLLEFVDIDKRKIILNSSIAAIEMLKKEEHKSNILKVMIKLFIKSDSIDTKKTYYYFKRQMVSFSNISLLFSGLGSDELNNQAVKYYEAIVNTKFAKNNPFFWLQYGIQKLNEKEYDIADRFFDNGLSFAKKRGMDDFYQINAQKARGIIEKLNDHKINPNEAFTKFEQAHQLLLKDFNNKANNKFYQLRQSVLYEKFYKEYYANLTEQNQLNFLVMTFRMNDEVNDFIDEKYLTLEEVHYFILEAQNSLKRITDEISE